MYSTIVAGTDLSKTARVATDRAAALATRLDAKFFLVHAGEGSDELTALGDEYGAEVIVEAGDPSSVLISEVERLGADLLVVGSVGMRGARRFLLGSVPNKVSHHAPTDLLIVKTDPPPREIDEYQSVLVGTDGSPTATRAVKAVSTLASKLGIKPLIVCAYEPLTEQEMKQLRGDPEDPVVQWNAPKAARDVPSEFRWRIADAVQAQDILDRAGEVAREAGVEAELKALEGHAAETLLGITESESIDLIAVGSVGMTGAKRFMLGNVPNRISHHSPTDVLILHTTG